MEESLDTGVSKGTGMMQKRSHAMLFVILTVSAFGAGTVWGGRFQEKKQDRQEIRNDKREQRTTKATFVQLSKTVDRWVEANLKGDDKRVKRYEQAILNQIRDDIVSSQRLVDRYDAEIRRSAKECQGTHSSQADRHDNRADLRDDVKDLYRARQLLKIKERLASTLSRTATFSNKYRLLGDYLETLRRELGMVRVELVEDVNEFHEDRAERHRE